MKKPFGRGKDAGGVAGEHVLFGTSTKPSKAELISRAINGYNGENLRWYQKNLLFHGMPSKHGNGKHLSIFDILKNHDRAALVSPTATGKTIMMIVLSAIVAFDGKTVIFSGGRNALRDQTTREMGKFQKFLGIESNATAMNWQTAAILAKRILSGIKPEDLSPKDKAIYDLLHNIALMIFDEVHLGGSGEAVSFNNIINVFKPNKLVFVTATHWDVNNKMFDRNNQMAIFHIGDAMLPGPNGENPPLNSVEFNRLNSSLDIGAVKFSDILHGIKRYTVNDAGEKIDHWADIINDVLKGNTTAKVENFKDTDARSLSNQIGGSAIIHKQIKDLFTRNRANTASFTYFQDAVTNGVAEKALFFFHTRDEADAAVAIFNKMASDYNLPCRGKAYHGRQDNSNEPHNRNEENLNKFVDPNSNISALFCVGMLNEGFDFLDLRFVFDCAFSTSSDRIARIIQRLGRVLRPIFDKNGNNIKKVSQYYYVEDVPTYVPNGFPASKKSTVLDVPSDNKKRKNKLKAAFSETDIEETAEEADITATRKAAAELVMAASGHEKEDECTALDAEATREVIAPDAVGKPHLISHKLSKTKQPLWIINNVRNSHSRQERQTYHQLFKDEDAGKDISDICLEMCAYYDAQNEIVKS